MNRRIVTWLALAGAVVSMSACAAGNDDASSGKTTVNWWTWDERQAASYKKCIPGFNKEHPDVAVKISQYNVEDYFTKLTTGFVAGTAPDAFQNSVPLLGEYAGQKQIMPLDDLIADSHYNLDRFSVGVNSWKYTDGKQYGIPLDWAASAIYFDKDAVAKAGFTDDDIKKMTWNPKEGGTFDDIVAHLTIDKKGVRGDEPGFDKSNVATYGISTLASSDVNGQSTWNAFAQSTGWRMGNKPAWPTRISMDDQRLVDTAKYVRSLEKRGFAPAFGKFTVAASEQIGSGSVAMVNDGSWMATSYAKLKNKKIGIAPTVDGPEGRSVISNSNANNIWVGTKHVDATWAWVTYMGSEACQSLAGADGTFLPSIAASMKAATKAQTAKGVDLTVFSSMLANGELVPSPPTINGKKLDDALKPMIESYFTGDAGDEIFRKMSEASEEILAP